MENWSHISLCVLLGLTTRWAVSINSYSGWFSMNYRYFFLSKFNSKRELRRNSFICKIKVNMAFNNSQWEKTYVVKEWDIMTCDAKDIHSM